MVASEEEFVCFVVEMTKATQIRFFGSLHPAGSLFQFSIKESLYIKSLSRD